MYSLLSVVIPIAAFAFVGVEIVSAAAVEGRHPRDLQIPANYITPFTTAVYLLLMLMFAFDAYWRGPDFPPFYENSTIYTRNTPVADSNSSTVYPVIVVAVQNAHITGLPGFLVGSLVLAAFSAANTALYVASRSLYGITRDLEWHSANWAIRLLAYLGTTNDNMVPHWALLLSAVAFGSWIPALHFARGHPRIEDVSCEKMSALASP